MATIARAAMREAHTASMGLVRGKALLEMGMGDVLSCRALALVG
jgi:hypothetical protein